MKSSRGNAIRFLFLILVLHLGWSGPVRADTLEYCWKNNCYSSLSEAESAMRSYHGLSGKYLENHRTTLSATSFPYTKHYAADIHPLDFHAPYAFWSFQPVDHCINNYQTPDHYDKCNSLDEAAAKADEYFLSSPAICYSNTTPDGGGYLQNQAGGAATSDSRNWFAAYLGISSGRVTIRQFWNPMETVTRLHSEDCAIDHVASGYAITVLEYGYCPNGLFDDYDNTSTVSGGVRKYYPYECSYYAIETITVRKALPTASCAAGEGNPCDPLTGNKRISKTDFEHASLPLSRHYHSLDLVQTLSDVGRGWNHNYDARVSIDSGIVMVHLSDGSISHFNDAADGTTYVSDQLPNVLLYLPSVTTAELHYDNGDVWYFEGDTASYGLYLVARQIAADAGRSIILLRDEFQRVTEVIDASGRSLTFHYQDDELAFVVLPDGEQIRYGYETPTAADRKQLVQVTYQDGSAIVYEYGDTRHPYHVTAIIDELGNTYASYAYDETGKVVMSEHAGGAGRVELSYDGLDTTVTTPSGDTRVYDGATFGGYHGNQFPSYNSIAEGSGTRSVIWRSGQPRRKQSQTDAEGNQTQFQYDALSRTTSTTRAAGSFEAVETVAVWDSDHNRVVELREPGVTTFNSYNTRAQVLTRTRIDTETLASRTWSYSYFEAPALAPLIGRVQMIDGPRTDVADITSYEYYSSDHLDGDYLAGDLKAVINALGHHTDYLEYDDNGRPLRIRDANNVLTVITYHPRGWVQSRTSNGQTTSFAYDATGNLTRVTQPDGSFIAYEYDEARRLTAVADNFDNRLEYALDASGNRIEENTFDENGLLSRQLSRVYDQLNRLDSLIDGNGDTTSFAYDNNGNRTSTLDANMNSTFHEFDGLDRLTKTIDAVLGETLMGYDARNNLVSVADPLGNITQYIYDGLDNRIQLDSPDTGITQYEYDSAGNRTAATDTRGVRVEYRYDSLNRLTDISHPDSSLDVGFTYDMGSNGKGRLVLMTDPAGTVDYGYDARGNLVSETRTIGANQYIMTYDYNAADRLTRMTYPSGLSVDYALDAAGRIASVEHTVGTVTATLANNIQYSPFGPVTSFNFGNGSSYAASFNMDYELERLLSGPGLDWEFTHDPVGNILAIDDGLDDSLDQTFSYDDLHRLETAQGVYSTETFDYDPNGNRTRYRNAVVDELYSYETQSNRLSTQNGWTFNRDTAGNRISKLDAAGYGQSYAYADNNRLSAVTVRNGSEETVVGSYQYDGRGQRVVKAASGKTVHFIYGPAGELIGEYDADAPESWKEYIYLNGQAISLYAKEQTLRQPPGAVVMIDNDDPQTSSTGSWNIKNSELASGNDYRQSRKKAGNTYRWAFTGGFPGSTFRVSARWVSHKSFSANAAYSIKHQDGIDTVTVNQKNGGGQWHELGVFRFSGSEAEWVEVGAANGKTSADAVLFEEITEPETITTEATYFIHADHLGSPRRLSDEFQTIVWRWDPTPFGHAAPNADPDGNSQEFVLNLRYPGQYYEGESGLHYNHFRTYDPRLGRYIESDPIGLRGAMNTFEYAGSNPILNIDINGLAYFAFRPLSGLNGPRHCGAGSISDRLNIQLSHEELFFEDGRQPGHLGLHRDGRVRPDVSGNLDKYSCRSKHYNDCVMRKAVSVTQGGNYCFVGLHGQNNCQDWAERVRANYQSLLKDPSVQQECFDCER